MKRTEQTRKGFDLRFVVMGLSVLVAVLMLLGKLGAYFLTGSTAILSDAAESVVHLFATGFAAFSLWYAATPPDRSHPYGHGKVSYFAAGVEGGFVLIAAFAILYSAGQAFLFGPALEELGTGLLIVAGLCLLNLLLGTLLVQVGRRRNSLILISNGQHVLADMWTSLGVLAGVGLVWLTGIVWLDPLVAVLIALHLLWTGFRLMRRSVSGLMEKADAAESEQLLAELNRAKEEGLIAGFHQVRHRRVGDRVWIEYHLLFPSNLSITDAHDRSHAVEEAVADLFPQDEVTVTAHLEPDQHEEAHPEGHAEPPDPFRYIEGAD